MSWEVISSWIEGHPGLASWVQAVGSIAAILAAIWIASRDSRLMRKAEAERKKNAIVRAEAAVREASVKVDVAIGMLKESLTSTQIKILCTGLSQSQQHLTETISSEGVESKIYTQLFLARVALEDIVLFVSSVTSTVGWNKNTHIAAQKRLQQIEAVLAELTAMQRG